MEPDHRTRTILIVDDSRFSREILMRRLATKGFEVAEAESGEAALALIQENSFDLVLLDLEMPDLDGVATLNRIRTQFPVHKLPVLMLSAHQESSDVVEALSAGANDYVSKSSDFAVILARIETHLAIRRLTEQISEIAIHDDLTSLYNRRGFREAAEREEQRHRRHGTRLQAILLDLDHFKQVNDDHGHRVGDQVLRKVAKALSSAVRATDILGRWGGEEFALLLPETGPRGAVISAERLRNLVAGVEIAAPSGALSVTISAGVASYDESCRDLDHLMQRADRALYEAKRTGRNRVCVYREDRAGREC